MESALYISAKTPSLTLFTVTKALNRHFTINKTSSSSSRFTRRFTSFHSRHASSVSSPPLRSLCALSPFIRRLHCISSSDSSFANSGGGNGIGGDAGGGGGGGSGDGGDSKRNLATGATEDLSALSPDVIILDVGGMTCGGCAASVKRILENQPQVSSATVNLTTETAIVWPVPEAKVVPNWQKQLGEALAKHLSACGFSSSLRVAAEEAIEGDI